MKTKLISCQIPSGLKATVEIPQELDEAITEAGIKAVLGALFVMTQLKSPEQKRVFIMRYSGSLASLLEQAARSVQMTNKISPDAQQIVEDFLKSIHKQ